MDRLITFPEVKGDLSVVMNCFSQVQSNGKMEGTNCYLQNNYDEPFASAVIGAAKKARMNPAIVSSQTRDVYVQFRVEFIAEKDQRNIHFYLNPGYEENVKAYGYDHIAGQRVIGKNEPWSTACPKRAQYAVWVRAYLGEDGKADIPNITHADGVMPVASCLNAIEQTIVNSRYTPAFADGHPVPSTYIEPFGN